MNQLRLDPLTGRWVVVSTERANRPLAFAPRMAPIQADTSRPCPFCPGNEESVSPTLETKGARWLADRASSVIPEQAGKLVSLLEEARSALRAVGRPTDSINWSALLDEVIPLLEEGRVDEARLQILDRCQPEPPGLPADS